MRLFYLSALFLCSCANPFMPMTAANPERWNNCEDVDCVVAAIDALPMEERECNEPAWMEGYEMKSLRWLLDHGRLTINKWSDFKKIEIILIGGYAAKTVFRVGPFGDFYSADIYYLSDPEFNNIAHELMHVAGPCSDSDPFERYITQRDFFDYTKIQKEIMDVEGVHRWVDTWMYKHLMWSPWYSDKQYEEVLQ